MRHEDYENERVQRREEVCDIRRQNEGEQFVAMATDVEKIVAKKLSPIADELSRFTE